MSINRIAIRGSGDSTPGGTTDVWMWEDGIGLLWETNIPISLD